MITDTKTLAAKLRELNEWRRGADLPMPDPASVGVTIDEAAARLEELDTEAAEWQNMAHSRKLQADAARRELAARKEACR